MNKYRLKAFQTVFCPDLRARAQLPENLFIAACFFLIRLYMWETGKSELCLIVLNNLYYLNYKLYKSFCMG